MSDRSDTTEPQMELRPPPEHAHKLWHDVEMDGARQSWAWIGGYWIPGSGKLTPQEAWMWNYVGPKKFVRNANEQ